MTPIPPRVSPSRRTASCNRWERGILRPRDRLSTRGTSEQRLRLSSSAPRWPHSISKHCALGPDGHQSYPRIRMVEDLGCREEERALDAPKVRGGLGRGHGGSLERLEVVVDRPRRNRDGSGDLIGPHVHGPQEGDHASALLRRLSRHPRHLHASMKYMRVCIGALALNASDAVFFMELLQLVG